MEAIPWRFESSPGHQIAVSRPQTLTRIVDFVECQTMAIGPEAMARYLDGIVEDEKLPTLAVLHEEQMKVRDQLEGSLACSVSAMMRLAPREIQEYPLFNALFRTKLRELVECESPDRNWFKIISGVESDGFATAEFARTTMKTLQQNWAGLVDVEIWDPTEDPTNTRYRTLRVRLALPTRGPVATPPARGKEHAPRVSAGDGW